MDPMMNQVGNDEATEASPDNEQAEGESAGYTICVHVLNDGTFSVGMEPLEDAAEGMPGESQGMPGMEDQGMPESEAIPVETIEQALKAVLHLYQQHPIEGSEAQSFANEFQRQQGR